ncbi:MAG: hypothetical protein FWE36_08855 [Erysipelotrichales bacterium]|nr:hypothetical protein [Erysipelotrichales bacterium]
MSNIEIIEKNIVFMSWSKPKSKELTEELKLFLERLFSDIEFFISSGMQKGELADVNIHDKLINSQMCLVGITKENIKSPWLMYEAGAVFGSGGIIVPIHWEYIADWHSWIDKPLIRNVQVKFIKHNLIKSKNEFKMLAGSIEEKFNIRYRNFENEWAKFVEKIILIMGKEEYSQIDASCEEFVNKLSKRKTFVLDNPYYNKGSTHFLSGFESFDLYQLIIEEFLFAGKRLWIYGRKNMKLFSGSYSNFFKYLLEKTSLEHSGISGIDFRCLFLDPNSNEVETAHLNTQILKLELESTILRAKNEIKNNDRLKKCFRLYENKRDEIIIRIDDIIIYSKPLFYADGRPSLSTNSNFKVLSANSDFGKYCVEKFEEIWQNASEMK